METDSRERHLMTDTWQTATYTIAPLYPFQTGSLDDQWSACNGIDGMGHVEEDKELNQARRRHGECLNNQPGCPRLILFRQKKTRPLMMKLWYSRTFQKDDDVHLVYGSLAKALILVPGLADHFTAEVCDFYRNAPYPVQHGDDRYELSIELCDRYDDRAYLLQMWRRFMKHFDEGAWE